MPYPTPRLGIAPLIAAELVKDGPKIIDEIKSLFTGSSYDATHAQIVAWAQTITRDPALTSADAADAWLRLRCWAGDQTVVTPATVQELFGGGNVAQGCGCETAHGCRQDAQQAVATLKRNIPSLVTGHLSSSPWTNPVTGQPVADGGNGPTTTLPVPIGGGVTIGIPVPTSTVLGATIGGIPILAWGAGALLLVAALGGHNRGRR